MPYKVNPSSNRPTEQTTSNEVLKPDTDPKIKDFLSEINYGKYKLTKAETKQRDKKIAQLRDENRPYVQRENILLYTSRGDPTVNINCRVSAFKKKNTRINKRKISVSDYIACRHLSAIFSSIKRKIMKTRFFLNLTRNPESLYQNPVFNTEDTHTLDEPNSSPETGYFFHYTNFSDVLLKLVKNHWGEADYEEGFNFFSYNHAMSIRIINENNGAHTRVQIYDPNAGHVYSVARIYNPQDIYGLTLDSFSTSTNDLTKYFKHDKDDGFASLVSEKLVKPDQPKNTHLMSYKATPGLCSALTFAGHFTNSNIGRTITYNLTGDEAAKIYCNSFILWKCIFNNNDYEIKCIIESILSSKMTQEQKITALTSNGIMKAFMMNNAEAIEIFCKAILDNKKTSQQDQYVILKKTTDFINVAFKEENPQAVEAMVKAILTSEMSTQHKENLLTIFDKDLAKDYRLTSPKSLAIFSKTITDFASNDLKNKIFTLNHMDPSIDYSNIYKTIVSSSMEEITTLFEDDEIFSQFETTEKKLVYAVNTMISAAKNKKNYKNITNFLTKFLANDKLTDSQKQQVLLQIDSFTSLKFNIRGEDAFRIVKTILNDSSLTVDQKAKALINDPQQPCMDVLVQSNNPELIEKITKEILNSNLPETDILKLLQPYSRTSYNWLYIALNSEIDLSKVIENFSNMVLESKLSKEAKFIILSSFDPLGKLVTITQLKEISSSNSENKGHPNNIKMFINALERYNSTEKIVDLDDDLDIFRLAINSAFKFGNSQYLAKILYSSNLNSKKVLQNSANKLIDEALKQGNQDFIDNFIIYIYNYKKLNSLLWSTDEQGISISQNIMTRTDYDFIKRIGKVSTINLYNPYHKKCSYSLDIKHFIKQAITSNDLSEKQKVELLTNTKTGTSLIYKLFMNPTATLNNKEESILIIEKILDTLPSNIIIDLFQGRNNNQGNILYEILSKSKTCTRSKIVAGVFANAVLNNTKLSTGEKVKLLTSIDKNGKKMLLTELHLDYFRNILEQNESIYSYLHDYYNQFTVDQDLNYVLQNPDTDFSKTYVKKMILTCTDDEKEFIELFGKKQLLEKLLPLNLLDENYFDEVINEILKLPDNHAVDILHNSNAKKPNFLYDLLSNPAQANLAKIFFNLIIDNKNLSTKDKIKILTPIDKHGKIVALRCFSKNRALQNLIFRNSPEKKEIYYSIFLSCNHENADEDLNNAFQSQDTNFIKNYIDDIFELFAHDPEKAKDILCNTLLIEKLVTLNMVSSDYFRRVIGKVLRFANSTAVDILQAKSANEPNFVYKMLSNPDKLEIAKVFFDLILADSNLSTEDKIKILTPVDKLGNRVALRSFSENKVVKTFVEKIKNKNNVIYNSIWNYYNSKTEDVDLYNAFQNKDTNLITTYINEVIDIFSNNREKIKEILGTKQIQLLDKIINSNDNNLLNLFLTSILNHKSLSEEEKISIVSNKNEAGESLLYRLLEGGGGLLDSYKKAISQSKLSNKSIVQLLQVDQGSDKNWLYNTLNKTDDNSFQSFKKYLGMVINNESLSKTDKLKLLTIVNNEGRVINLKNIKSNSKVKLLLDSINSFIKNDFNNIQNSNISIDKKIKQLLNKDSNGNTLLYKILETNDTKMLTEAITICLNGNLDESDLVEILKAKDHLGVPWLYNKFISKDNDSVTSVETFINLILKSSLSIESKIDLLRLVNKKNKTITFNEISNHHPLYAATILDSITTNNFGTVNKIYTDIKLKKESSIFDSFLFFKVKQLFSFIKNLLGKLYSNKEKNEILNSKSLADTLGLYRLFNNDDYSYTLRVYLNSIIVSDLMEKDKEKALKALSNNKNPGFNQAFANNNIECVKAFTEIIVESDLPEKVKVILLRAKNNSKLTAFQTALENNSKSSITFFKDYISKSSKLSKKNKKILLSERS